MCLIREDLFRFVSRGLPMEHRKTDLRQRRSQELVL